MKIESHTRLDEREKNLQKEFEKRQLTVEQVHSQKDKASEAMEGKRRENKEIRDQVSKDMGDMAQRRKVEDEIEMKRR